MHHFPDGACVEQSAGIDPLPSDIVSSNCGEVVAVVKRRSACLEVHVHQFTVSASGQQRCSTSQWLTAVS